MNIVEAIQSEKLFKPCFRDLNTWASWLTLLKCLFALELNDSDLSLYQQCTGRKKPPEEPFKELWAVVGRRGGKSYIAALIAVYLALFHDYKRYLAPGERGSILVVSADRAQSQTILGYCKGILNSNPVFSQYVENELKESIDLNNSISIEVMSCSYRLTRGRTVVCALFDEISFFRVEGANPDREILSAIRPAMATIPNSLLISISSPYARSGVLYETHKEYFGVEDSEILVWQAETRLMNPTIPQNLIDKETKKDPTSARSEYGALFRDDVSAFFDPDIIEKSAVLPGILAADRYTTYQGFVDPSGGRSDAFSLAIGHFNFNKDKYQVDRLKAWASPFDPSVVVQEIAEILSQYRVSRVVGDRYAGAWVSSAFEKEKIQYEVCDKAKSELYLTFEGYLNTNQVEFPNDEQLITELTNLERRRGRAGKDIIDHPPRGQDDSANSLAGLIYLLARVEGSAFQGCDLS